MRIFFHAELWSCCIVRNFHQSLVKSDQELEKCLRPKVKHSACTSLIKGALCWVSFPHYFCILNVSFKKGKHSCQQNKTKRMVFIPFSCLIPCWPMLMIRWYTEERGQSCSISEKLGNQIPNQNTHSYDLRSNFLPGNIYIAVWQTAFFNHKTVQKIETQVWLTRYHQW